jgi:hypothetical protein
VKTQLKSEAGAHGAQRQSRLRHRRLRRVHQLTGDGTVERESVSRPSLLKALLDDERARQADDVLVPLKEVGPEVRNIGVLQVHR